MRGPLHGGASALRASTGPRYARASTGPRYARASSA